MQVWTVANQKGGVGKTTTAVALAGLAAEAGQRVLMVDLDPHGSLSSYFRQDRDGAQSSVFTLFEQASTLSPALVGQIVRNTDYERLYILPSVVALATLERRAIGPDGLGLVLRKALAQVHEDFDLAVVDCPPQLGVLMVNALAACQRLIIPVQTEFLALKGLERMLNTLQMMSRSRQHSLPYLIVPTMFDRRTQASVSSLRTLRTDYGDQLWSGKIPIDTKFRDASKAGIPPHLLAPDSHGVVAYISLYNNPVLQESLGAPIKRARRP